MLNIVTKPKHEELIYDVENMFIYYSGLYNDELRKDKYTKIMQLIDKVEMRNGNYIDGPLGSHEISSLSSGCKAVILCLLLYSEEPDKVVNITECGQNAIDVLVNICRSRDIRVYAGTELKIDARYKIDGKDVDLITGYQLLSKSLRYELNREWANV